MEPNIPQRARRVLDVVAITLFLAAILAPTVDQCVRSDQVRGPAPELRNPEPRPPFPWPGRGLHKFPAKYERFFSDTFGLRDVLLRLNSLEKLYVFGVAPSPNLAVGADRWIYYRGDRSIEAYRGLLPMTVEELEKWKTQLELRQSSLARHGIRYVFGIVPNKETIYPERMPPSMTRVGPTRLEQFMPWMRANSSVPIFDLRPALLAAKSEDKDGDYVYFPHGTHWDGRGTIAAYDAIMNALREYEPNLHVFGADELEWSYIGWGSDTWATSMYIPDVLVQGAHFPQRKGGVTWEVVSQRSGPPKVTQVQNREHDQPAALFFHDSFGPSLTVMLGESFSPLCMHWGGFDPHVVAEVQPDLVVEMYVERALVYAPPGPGSKPDDYVLRSLFGSLPNVLVRVDGDWTNRFTSVDSLPVSIVHEELGDALRFERRTAKQGLISPEIVAPKTGDVFGRIDVECATPCVLDVFWKPANSADFKRADHVGVEVGHGRSMVTFRLNPAPGPTRLLLRPRASGTVVTLREFEVRSKFAP